ncbi:type VI secretion system protein TssA [Aquincola sp. S2]|uniref:Type VI secretion system protein TssA n=1 Tax=Pseudaquabacterium terrae TaxID=2732868 RepID=A0ABX2ELC9_9BURK|nr:type VI secretion system protein TssA [Aquabacterium terrae]NRF69453.1 type VI secretion system protein TssA [Aquabacterium terrae]
MEVTATLLQPIAEASPCGEDLSFSDEFDLIAELRREDDASLPLGEWKEKGKEPKVADWAGVETLCAQLLRTRSKDLRLAGWLADAWAQRRGLAGLADGLALCTGLIEQHWDELHPRSEDGDREQRIGSLSWLLTRSVPLVRLAREAPAVPLRRADAAAALQALTVLQQAVDGRLGDDGPSFVGVRDALKALLADLPAEVDFNAPDGAVVGIPGNGVSHAGSALAGGPLQTRAQALQQLRQVADFFRRTEPHSPVAYLAEKAARWGSTDLHGWLRTVVKDGASLAHLEELLGIEPPKTPG